MSAGDFPTQGIDVSHWQASLPDLTGVDFVVVKATEGTTTDPMWSKHYANSRKAGKLTGAYHFCRDDVDVAKQIAYFLSVAGQADFLALDNEGAHAFNLTQMKQAVSLVHAAGRKVVLYMSESVFMSAGQDADWVANYSREPARHYDIWQYGPYLGVDGNVSPLPLAYLAAKVGAITMSVVGELILGPLPPVALVLPKAGAKIVDSNGNTIRLAVAGDKFPRIGDTGTYSAYRVPGGKVAYTIHGMTLADEQVPPPVDTTPYSQADLDAAVAAADAALADAIAKANAEEVLREAAEAKAATAASDQLATDKAKLAALL